MFSAPAQSDLFDAAAGDGGAAGPCSEPPDEAFVDGIRRELRATLAKVDASSDRLPWADPTRAYLAEMRFRSIARWLPEPEARGLVHSFDEAIDRVYAAIDAGEAETTD